MKPNYHLLTSLMTYFHDLRTSNMIKLQVSPFNLVKNNLGVSNIEEELLTPESLTPQERSAMIALDICYGLYVVEQASKCLPSSQQDFQFRYLSTKEGHKVYEACIANALTKISSAPVTLQDLKSL